jgi:hypothetical protein
MDARNALIRGQENVQDSDENFDVSKGSPVVVSGSNIFKDRAIAYATFGLPKLQFQLGRNEINWGPGVRGSLAISKNMPATDMIRFRVNFQNLQFTSIHAFLSNPLGAKYLAAHRLDIAIFPSIHIGATETVVYGQRDIELAYINPIMPYHIAEHHLGDQDNNNLSFDVTLTAFSSVKLYGEYFIDDMTSTQNLLKYYGNKFAFLFGLHWVDPLSFDNMGLRCEYTRIEPFVYSHRDSINIYTHYDKTIGHWLGPNADNLYLQLTYQATRDLEIECFGERIRNGKGTASTFSEPVYGSRKYFLGGIVEKQYLLGLSISNQIRKDIFVTLSYTYSDTRNLFLQKNLNSYDHLARFKLYFNY